MKKSILLSILLSTLPCYALAQESIPPLPELPTPSTDIVPYDPNSPLTPAQDFYYTRLDLDQNGLISEYEFSVYTRYSFGKLDLGKNGQITKEEFQISKFPDPKKPPTEQDLAILEKDFAKKDTDNNGIITEYENMSVARENMAKADINKDSLINKEEFAAYIKANP